MGIANRRRAFFEKKPDAPPEEWCIMSVWRLLLTLSAVAEADRRFKPMLAGEGSSRPDRLNVLSDQALHIHFRYAVMDTKEIAARLTRF